MTRVRGMFQKQLKNRSSKQLRWMTGPGNKPITWSMSNDALMQASKENKNKGNIYEQELERRKRNAAKRKTPRPPCKKAAGNE